MKTIFQKILHEPLIHFLLFGSAIYIYFQVTTPPQTETQQAFQKQKIVLNKTEIENLQNQYQTQFHQKPNKELLKLLIDQRYKEKALLKEAYALQLYKNDKAIDKILLQKMHFILQKQQSPKDIDEKELYHYYKKHIQDYSQRENISFLHIHFNNLNTKQKEELYKLLHFAPPIKTAPKESHMTKDTIVSKYGTYFAKKLFLATKSHWLPAIATKDGYEFVYILNYQTAKPYPFADVEDRVYNDFKKAQELKNYQQQLKKLHKRYELYKEQ